MSGSRNGVRTMADDEAALIQSEARESMEKAIRSLKAEVQKVRTGRASVALLDGVQLPQITHCFIVTPWGLPELCLINDSVDCSVQRSVRPGMVP